MRRPGWFARAALRGCGLDSFAIAISTWPGPVYPSPFSSPGIGGQPSRELRRHSRPRRTQAAAHVPERGASSAPFLRRSVADAAWRLRRADRQGNDAATARTRQARWWGVCVEIRRGARVTKPIHAVWQSCGPRLRPSDLRRRRRQRHAAKRPHGAAATAMETRTARYGDVMHRHVVECRVGTSTWPLRDPGPRGCARAAPDRIPRPCIKVAIKLPAPLKSAFG